MDNLGYQKEPKTEPFWFEVLNLERQQTETHISNIYIYIYVDNKRKIWVCPKDFTRNFNRKTRIYLTIEN